MRAANERNFKELERKLKAIKPEDIVERIAGERLAEVQEKLAGLVDEIAVLYSNK